MSKGVMGNEQPPLRVRDWLLMALTVSSGAVDAISYLALGNIFTAFMTGNVVFLGLRMAGASSQSVVSLAVALAFFAAGVFLSTLIVKPSKGSGVWPRRATVALGVEAVAQACFLAVWVATGGQPPGGVVVVLLALWALAMGIQTGSVLSLGIPGVFTTAATATLTYLMSDLARRRSSSVEDMRRLAGVLVSLFAGAAVGALLLTYARTYAPAFPLVVTVFVVATAATVLRGRAAAADKGERR